MLKLESIEHRMKKVEIAVEAGGSSAPKRREASKDLLLTFRPLSTMLEFDELDQKLKDANKFDDMVCVSFQKVLVRNKTFSFFGEISMGFSI